MISLSFLFGSCPQQSASSSVRLVQYIPDTDFGTKLTYTDIATFKINYQTFYVLTSQRNGVETRVFRARNDGTLTLTESIADNEDYEINGAIAVEFLQVGSSTYLFVAGQEDDGISVFSISDEGILTNVDNIDYKEDLEYWLDDIQDIAIGHVGDKNYLYIMSSGALATGTHAINAFEIGDDGKLEFITSIKTTDLDFNTFHEFGVLKNILSVDLDDGFNYLVFTGVDQNNNNDDILAAYRFDGSYFSFRFAINQQEMDLSNPTHLASIKMGEQTYISVLGQKANQGAIRAIRIQPDGFTKTANSIASVNHDVPNGSYINADGDIATFHFGGTAYVVSIDGTNKAVSAHKLEILADEPKFTDSFSFATNSTDELSGASKLTVSEIDGSLYLATIEVADNTQDRFSVFRMDIANKTIENKYLLNNTNHFDANEYKLQNVIDLASIEIDGTTYIMALGASDEGFSVFKADSNGKLSHLTSIRNDTAVSESNFLRNGDSIEIVEEDNTIYVVVSGEGDTLDGDIGVVTFDPTADNVQNPYLQLFTQKDIKTDITASDMTVKDIAIDQIDGDIYVFAGGKKKGSRDEAVASLFALEDLLSPMNNSLQSVKSVFAREEPGRYYFNNFGQLATASLNGKTYLFVTGTYDGPLSILSGGLTVFETTKAPAFSYITGYEDMRKDRGFSALAVLEIGNTIRVFVGENKTDKISVYSFNGSTLSDITSVSDIDNVQYNLHGIRGLAVGESGTAVYLLAAGFDDDGVSVFSSSGSSLSHVGSVSDTPFLGLKGARAAISKVIDNRLYFYVAGSSDNAIQVLGIE